MLPIQFPETNVVYAKEQPQYLQLPAYKYDNGHMITCWQLTWFERLRILITGKLWLEVLTFNRPLQPLKPGVEKPLI